MKDRRLEEKPACSTNTIPVPAEVVCPECKTEIEIWSDETEVTCSNCGSIVRNRVMI